MKKAPRQNSIDSEASKTHLAAEPPKVNTHGFLPKETIHKYRKTDDQFMFLTILYDKTDRKFTKAPTKESLVSVKQLIHEKDWILENIILRGPCFSNNICCEIRHHQEISGQKRKINN